MDLNDTEMEIEIMKIDLNNEIEKCGGLEKRCDELTKNCSSSNYNEEKLKLQAEIENLTNKIKIIETNHEI